MKALFAPLQYFAVKNGTKWRVDVFPTTALAVCIVLLVELVGDVNVFGPGGIFANLAVLTAALTGFYVAALTAAATFNNPDLDHTIENGALWLGDKKLSRREWVCTIFGYLAFAAMAFTIAAAILVPVANAAGGSPALAWYNELSLHRYFSVVAKFGLSIWISHMFVVTMLGLHYLTSRMSDVTPAVTTTKSQLPVASS